MLRTFATQLLPPGYKSIEGMGTELKSRQQQGISSAAPVPWMRGILMCLCLGCLWSALALAQDQPARIPDSADAPPEIAITFSQSDGNRSAASARRTYSFPENECSADFWDPYAEDDASAISQSPVRVQQTLGAAIDPADTIQELPDEVVEPAQRVQQLNDEVIYPAEPIGGSGPARSIADSPGDHPDNP
jgi:hypothetical protein